MDKEIQTSSVMHAPGAILLISCYELGHRRIVLTHLLNALEAARFYTDTIDIAVEPLGAEKVKRARFFSISVLMHTALKLSVHLLQRIRELNLWELAADMQSSRHTPLCREKKQAHLPAPRITEAWFC